MSYVQIVPEILSAAAHDLQSIGAAVDAHNAAAAAPTTGVIPAAADEVSALTAAQFVTHAQMYHAVSARAAAIHQAFVTTLATSARSYAVTEAANAAAAQVARQRPDLAGDAWRAAGRLLASPWLRDEPHPPGPAFRRSSCCLFYRLAPGDPSAFCGDCVLTGRQANRERLSRTTSCSAGRHPLPARAWRAERAVSSPSGCAFGVVIATPNAHPSQRLV